ncbi:DUF4386 domain-containing protein [Phenylobacterium aquaticum]|uniref:DUF4386 domain-containing protein n=1 Tax=Phenylobacterium aquaticum TaxID=1763816 RepID=UPI0026F373A9|nr:DUF4386 domain-containing protein [Phenylobacterium aquaticum]
MADLAERPSPRALARLTGLLYLYIIVAAMFSEAFVRSRLIVSGDPAATVRNIAASEGLWRWGVAANVSTTLCDVAVAALLFVLLAPVNRTASLTAAAFRLAYAAAMAASAAFLVAPLLLLGDFASKSAIEAAQIQSLVSYSLRLHAAGFDVALVLFGVHLVLVGLLIARSTYLPRLLGAALAVAGACYIANSFIGFLAPSLAARLFPWTLLPGFVAESSLALWLLIAGVNPARWREA